jgi:outer membrane biosynthesis protein TonB
MSASRLEWGAPFDHTEALSRVGKLLGQDDQEEELDRLYDESKPVEEENDPPAGETSEPKEVEEPTEPAEETSEAMEVEGQVKPVEEPSEAMEAEEQVKPVEETSQVVGVEEEVEAHAEPEGERTVPRLFEGGW